MVAIAAVIGPAHVGKGFLRGLIRSIDAIADGVVIGGSGQNASHSAGGNIDHVVGQTPAVGKSGTVAGKQTEAAAAGHGGWRNACVEPQHVRDGTGRGARGAMGGA